MRQITIDPEQEVADQFTLIGTKVLPAIENELGGMPISAPARLWWVKHYTRTFFFAKIVMERDWAKDEAEVLARAAELGRKAQAAAVLAGHAEVEVADAKLASMHVDCGVWEMKGVGTAGALYRWC